jgi:hypothetical protein
LIETSVYVSAWETQQKQHSTPEKQKKHSTQPQQQQQQSTTHVTSRSATSMRRSGEAADTLSDFFERRLRTRELCVSGSSDDACRRRCGEALSVCGAFGALDADNDAVPSDSLPSLSVVLVLCDVLMARWSGVSFVRDHNVFFFFFRV